MKRFLAVRDAVFLLVGWWVLGAIMLAAWLISLGRYEIPDRVRADLPANPRNAFVAGMMCFGVGITEAARRLQG